MIEKFKRVFEGYAKKYEIYDNVPMMAAIMKALRALPDPDEQIRILEDMMPIRSLATYLALKNIDVNPIFAEFNKLPSQNKAAGKNASAPSVPVGGALQNPLSRLPRSRQSPSPAGEAPIVNKSVSMAAASDSNENGQPQPRSAPRGSFTLRRRHGPLPNDGATNNQRPSSADPNQDPEEEKELSADSQGSDEKDVKPPNIFSKIWASFNKVLSGKEGGKAAAEPKAQNAKEPKPKGKLKIGGRGFILGLGIGVVAILVVLLFLSASLMSSQDFSPSVAQAPQDSIQSTQDGSSPPVYVPDEAEMILELTEPMLKKPVNLEDLISNFPLRWLLWIGFLLPLFNQLKQDRFAAAEKTDLISIGIGIVTMLSLTVSSGAVSTFVSSYLVTTQMSTYPADFQASVNRLLGGVIESLMVIMGVAFNLGMQLSASQSGKRDYSALAVGGCFASGVILVWWYSGQNLIVAVGWLLMVGGMYLQAREMSKTYQGGGAVVVSFIMIAFFFLGFVVSSFAMKYIVQMNLPEIIAYFVYKSSLAVSVFFGGLISWSGGDYIATNILPPTKLAEGGDGEDSSASIAELPVTVKYDAMAFGMMIMYPLVSIWWYVSALVSTF